MIAKKMSGVAMIGYGGPDQLVWRDDLPVPQLRDDDVLIRVFAAGVNNTDINTRIGWYGKNDGDDNSWNGGKIDFPRIQGADVCGEIVAVGKDVADSRIGERVLIEPCLHRYDGQDLPMAWYFGSECDGGFAQYTKVGAIYAHAIDSDLTDVELASFPCSYSTAENMLTRANVGAKDTVFVTGASGGVGSAAIQLARARGARVIAVTSPDKAAAIKALGAEITLTRSDDYVATIGVNAVDVVIDLVAGDKWPSLLDILKPRGRYAVSGAIGGAMVDLDVRTLYLKDLSFFGCTVIEPEVFPNLIKRIQAKDIKPLVAQSFALRDIAAAQECFLSKKHIGKIVLKV